MSRRSPRLVRVLNADPLLFLACVAAIVVFGAISGRGNGYVPLGAIALPFLVGALFLSTRALVFLDVVAAAMLIYVIAKLGMGPNGARLGSVIVVGLTAAFAHIVARSRERLGVKGLRGETMLVDLRDRLMAQGRFPQLPGDWHVDLVLRSAGGSSFGGDFIVSALSEDGKRLEVAVVDVSGKGVDAGTRALQLSGALGGLLGSLPPQEFLGAANNYLLRQDWDEGFATAVHAAIDLATGEFIVNSAGHPPGVHFDAGAGRWRTIDAEGAMLGLLAGWNPRSVSGVLRGGDALLLYTDGLIELPGRDLDLGVDKLLGEAERLIPRGFAGGASRLIDAVAPSGADDRAIVLLYRG